MPVERQTPSETLMKALEDIEGAEDVIIVYRKKNSEGIDEVQWSINDTPLWRVLGLIETAKLEMIHELMEED